MKTRFRRIYLLLALILVTILGISKSNAQIYMGPRSISFGQAYATQARGADAIGWNAANLGLSDNPGFSLSYGVIPLVPVPAVLFGNNSVSASWANDYILSGKYLTHAEKLDMISVFPESGWRLRPLIQAKVLGLSFGHTAISVDGHLTGSLNMPKPLLKFVFFGNQFEEPITLDDMDAELQAVVSLSAAHGREMEVPFLSDYVRETYVGVGIKTLLGAAYAGTDYVNGAITTFHDSLSVEGAAKMKYSYLGYGLAFDAGVTAIINGRMRANFAVNNLFGFVKWPESNTQTFQYEFSLNNNIQEVHDSDADSLLEAAVVTDTSYSAQGFTTPYPTYFILGFQYDVLSILTLYANYKQGFSNRFDSSIIPQISVATEYRPLQWLPLRFGLNFGGVQGVQWGSGFGMEFNHYSLLLGFSQSGGVFNSSKGFSFALGQELRF